MVKKEDGHIKFSDQTAEEIEQMSRAYVPWPGVYTFWNDKKLELSEISVFDYDLKPGEVEFTDDRMLIGAKKGAISPRCVKIEGKNQCELTAFLRGYPEFKNAKF